MLDIELKWLLVLLVNFLVLVYILNILLFRPLLALFKERESSVRGSLDAARSTGTAWDRGTREGRARTGCSRAEPWRSAYGWISWKN